MFDLIKIISNKIIFRPYIRSRLGGVGKNFRIGHSSSFICPSKFNFGDHFFCGPNAYFSTNNRTNVRIGDQVMFGSHCKLLGGNHNVKWTGGRMMDAPTNRGDKGVVIENDVWVGCNAVILDGAYICEGAVVGASTVVTKYIPPYVVVAGVPSRVIKPRFGKFELEAVLKNVNTGYDVMSILEIYKVHGIEIT